MYELKNSEFTIKADIVLLAMGFISLIQQILDAFCITNFDNNTNVSFIKKDCDKTSINKVFTVGDMRRGQLLVV